MTSRFLACAAALLFGLQAPALAQSRPNGLWQVDWGDQYCTLVRLPIDGAPLVAGLRTVPGTRITELRVTRNARGLPDRVTSIMLAPSGTRFDAPPDGSRRYPGGLIVGPISERIWETLAGSTEMLLLDGREAVTRVPLSSSAGAVRALRACVSDALRHWNVDEAALNRLSALPRTTNGHGVTLSAIARMGDLTLPADRAARMILRLDVSAEGRATACEVAVSTGNRAIDSRACRLVIERGRFTPALDAEGRPTPARVISVMPLVAA